MQCQIEEDRFEFNDMLDKYVKDGNPNMALIRDQPQISTLAREDKKSTRKYIYSLLSDLNSYYKVNPEMKLKDAEIVDLTLTLMKDYFHYRVQDFALFVRNAKAGRYGKSFNRLDGPMIHEWIVKYDQERSYIQQVTNSYYKKVDTNERTSTKNKLDVERMKLNLGTYTQENIEKKKIQEQNKNQE